MCQTYTKLVNRSLKLLNKVRHLKIRLILMFYHQNNSALLLNVFRKV